jgi:hypothetical protein
LLRSGELKAKNQKTFERLLRTVADQRQDIQRLGKGS